ncbi:MAG: phosphoribosylamine--glycine ligase [Vicinamibacterales bacterium]|nr:phosphoribosylamine--glycine ligase [Vicinamibacterales bacterium]
MRVLVIGAGAREHAFCRVLAGDVPRGHLHVAPGNAGMADAATCHPVQATDVDAIVRLVDRERIDLTVVGPELPLTRGVVDRLSAAGHRVCGPTRDAAALESSKAFAKDLMVRHGIPTARHQLVSSFDEAMAALRGGTFSFPVVLKADGLAAGKGVIIAGTLAEAEAEARDMMVGHRFGDAGERMVIEEFMTGREASFFVLTDGEHARVLPTAEDHKRAFDGDRGPNTGGMGAFSPSPLIDTAQLERILESIVHPTLRAMKAEGRPYAGFLYCGLMLTPDGPKVVEFNARMGDPETQVVLPALAEPLLPHLHASARGQLEPGVFKTLQDRFVGVVLASGGYPDTFETGKPIHGLDAAAGEPGVTVYHAATVRQGDDLLTAGGRVLTIVGRGPSFAAARERAYAAVGRVSFDGAFCRSDIGVRAVQDGGP